MNIELKKISRKTLVLFSGEMIAQICGLLRNMLLARMLAPDQFGVASGVAIAVTFVEVVGSVNVGRYLTLKTAQESSGKVIGTAHFMLVFGGILTGAALFFLSPIIANVLNMSEYLTAFQAMCIVPIIRSFSHLNVWKQQADLEYTPLLLCKVLPQVLVLILVVPTVHILPDYRAMLLLSILNVVAYVSLSHLSSQSKYSLVFSRAEFTKIWKYSYPLWLDGLFMFWVLQGERVIIVREFGTVAAGIYSAIFLILWTPAAILSQLSQSIGVPYFSARIKDLNVSRDYLFLNFLLVSLALGFGVLILNSGQSIIYILYGEAYVPSVMFIGVLGIHYAIRVMRIAPTVVLLANGNTRKVANANFVRVLGTLVAWPAAIYSGKVEVVFVVVTIFELLANEYLQLSFKTLRFFQLIKRMLVYSMFGFCMYLLCDAQIEVFGIFEHVTSVLIMMILVICLALGFFAVSLFVGLKLWKSRMI